MAEHVEEVPAPGLREVAEVWWDSDRDPVVRWRDDGRLFVLVDPAEPADELVLARLVERPPDPVTVAATLAEGLAACDFPPTGDGAATGRVRATLRVAGLGDVLDERPC